MSEVSTRINYTVIPQDSVWKGWAFKYYVCGIRVPYKLVRLLTRMRITRLRDAYSVWDNAGFLRSQEYYVFHWMRK